VSLERRDVTSDRPELPEAPLTRCLGDTGREEPVMEVLDTRDKIVLRELRRDLEGILRQSDPPTEPVPVKEPEEEIEDTEETEDEFDDDDDDDEDENEDENEDEESDNQQ
jgi:hypothetical protein